MLLYWNIQDWVISKEKKSIWFIVLEAGKSKFKGPTSDECLHAAISNGRRKKSKTAWEARSVEETKPILSSKSILMLTDSFPTVTALVHSGRQSPGDIVISPILSVNTFAVEVVFQRHSNNGKHLMCLEALFVSLLGWEEDTGQKQLQDCSHLLYHPRCGTQDPQSKSMHLYRIS